MRIAFIGIGDMGGPMARNIAKAGFDLCVCDLRDEALEEAKGYGADVTASLAETMVSCDVIATCVRFEDQVRELFLGPQGIVALGRAGQIAVVHSTVTPELVYEITAAAEEKGICIVDAPVSGGRDRSRDGTLTMIVGADDASFKVVEELFRATSRQVVRVGVPGDAQVVKLGNNLMALAGQLLVMEAVKLVSAYGISRESLFAVAETSTGGSWGASNFSFYDRYGVEHTLAGSQELPYSLAKDLRLAMKTALNKQTSLPVTAMCSQLFPFYMKERWNNPDNWHTAR